MKKILLYIIVTSFISCNEKPKKALNNYHKSLIDTLEGDSVINQLDLGRLEVSFLDNHLRDKEKFYYGDTFYVDAKYIGEPKKLRENNEIVVSYTSSNLKKINSRRNGVFAFIIKPYPMNDSIFFDLSIKSEKYIFKHIYIDDKKNIENTFENYFPLCKYFIVLENK